LANTNFSANEKKPSTIQSTILLGTMLEHIGADDAIESARRQLGIRLVGGVIAANGIDAPVLLNAVPADDDPPA
jgi:hypothetical protein